jgi:hypothetical protein
MDTFDEKNQSCKILRYCTLLMFLKSSVLSVGLLTVFFVNFVVSEILKN